MYEFIDNAIQNFRNELSTNQFLSAGVIIGIITSILIYLRTVPQFLWTRLTRLIIFTATIEERTSGNLFVYVENWIKAHKTKVYRNVDGFYFRGKGIYTKQNPSDYDYPSHKKTTPKNILTFKHREDYFYLFKYGRYIKINKNKEKLEHINRLEDLFYDRYVFSGIFSKKAISKFLSEIIEYNHTIENIKENVTIYYSDEYGNIRNSTEILRRDIKTVIINPSTKEFLINDIQNFTGAKQWYADRGIKYKRGYLFYGPPGNGKTSMVIAIASLLGIDITIVNVGILENDYALSKAFSQAYGIIVIEDIDKLLDKKKLRITMSGLLNVMDGIFSPDGTIYIFTTNHPESLDQALMRSGRIDVKVRFDYPGKTEMELFLENFFKEPLEFQSNHLPQLPMSTVREICIRNKNNPAVAMDEIKTKDFN